jgi:uncharacterized protein (TIGR00369 family)
MTFRKLPVQAAHVCFACGHDNPIGLHMEFETDERTVRSPLVVPESMCGWRQVAHGGIVCTVLDEVMSNAAIYLLERLIMTRQIEVEFLRPVRVGQPLLASAWVKERPHERKVVMQAELQDAAGAVAARASGVFALFTPERFAELAQEQEIVESFERFLRDCGKPGLR